MSTVAEIQARIDKLQTNMTRLDGIVNGPASGTGSTVTIDSGTVKSVAKTLADVSITIGDGVVTAAQGYATAASNSAAEASVNAAEADVSASSASNSAAIASAVGTSAILARQATETARDQTLAAKTVAVATAAGLAALTATQVLAQSGSTISTLASQLLATSGVSQVIAASALKANLAVNAGDYLNGAVADGSVDLIGVLEAAHAAVPEGGHLYIPTGTWPVSRTWTVTRTTVGIYGPGVIVPFGSFSDYLVWNNLTTPGGNATLKNVGNRVSISGLNLDGKWQARGLKETGTYLSSLDMVSVVRPYGTAICVDQAYESSFNAPVITRGKRRVATWLAGVQDWSSSNTYAIGDVVRRYPDAWSSAVSYGAADTVLYNGKVWRSSKTSGNLNVTPGTNTANWVETYVSYYQCAIVHSNKDPISETGYTTNSATSGNRYWNWVLEEEPVIQVANTIADKVVDNITFFRPIIRDCEHNIEIYIDQCNGTRPALNISFYGGQLHTMTPGLDGVDGLYGPTKHRHVICGLTQQITFKDTIIRPGGVDNSTCIEMGVNATGKAASEVVFDTCELSGEGANQVGIYVGPVTGSQRTAKNFVAVNNQLLGTAAIKTIDPAAVLRRHFSTPLTVGDDSLSRPAYSFDAYPTHGFRALSNYVSVMNVNGEQVLRHTVSSSGAGGNYINILAGSADCRIEAVSTGNCGLLLRASGTSDIQPESHVRPATSGAVDLGSGTKAFGAAYTVNGYYIGSSLVIDSNRNFRARVYTVGTLPAASSAAGLRAQASDANSPTFAATVTGGGSTHVPVYSDGTNWRCG